MNTTEDAWEDAFAPAKCVDPDCACVPVGSALHHCASPSCPWLCHVKFHYCEQCDDDEASKDDKVAAFHSALQAQQQQQQRQALRGPRGRKGQTKSKC